MICVPKSIPVTNTNAEQRKQFDCGNHALNSFLRRHSESNHSKGFGKTFVLVIEEEVIGYYTVSMSSTLEFMNNSSEKNDSWPRYPIPVGLIGKLAVSKDKQGKGWGKWLLTDAILRVFNAAHQVGAYAILVDAKDEDAKKFYERYGFLAFPKKAMTLYMTLDSISDLVKETDIHASVSSESF